MIEIRDLYKAFDTNEVLRGVNLTIHRGETTVIIGRSGCGKSVLLKLITGLLTPDQGHIVIDDMDITTLHETELNKLRMRIGMLFQGSALFDSLTVGENVGFSLLEHTDTDKETIAKRVRSKLRLVGLAGIEQLEPAQLSGGMKKRVGLARAICMDPEIILYDEPTTGLDPIMADSINDLLLRMKERLRVTSIVVTHDMKSAYKVGDRLAMLYEGKIIATGTPDEIRHSSNSVVKQFVAGLAHGPITADKSRFVVDEEV